MELVLSKKPTVISVLHLELTFDPTQDWKMEQTFLKQKKLQQNSTSLQPVSLFNVTFHSVLFLRMFSSEAQIEVPEKGYRAEKG